MTRRQFGFFFTKVFNYEYWPYPVFYFPMYFYGLYLAAKSRSITYFSTANPGMKFGGVVGESKYRTLRHIDPCYLPKTILIPANSPQYQVKSRLEENGLSFPIIVKPDVGERGKNVERIKDFLELEQYFACFKKPCIIQEFVDAPLELGVLYYRKSSEARGHVSSVTIKKYLKIQGDGSSSLEALMHQEIRAQNRLGYLKAKHCGQLHEVLPPGAVKCLEPIGNHCRGTTFLNGSHLINSRLERVFDAIAAPVPGFHYGRFDIKVSSLEDLYTGRNIKVLELNGVSSEPAHVYDPDHSLVQAYRDVAAHMRVIYEISRENYRLGHPRARTKDFLAGLGRHFSNK